MKKKTFFILIVSLASVLFFLWWFFFRSKPETQTPPNPTPTTSPCLVFQSTDPQLSCFKEVVKPVTVATPLAPTPIDKCFGENTIEANGCITEVALEKKDSSLCSFVQGSYSQIQCKQMVENPKSQTINTSVVSSKIAPLNLFTAAPVSKTPIRFDSEIIDLGINLPKESEEEAAEMFFNLFEKNVPLELSAFSENQVSSGSNLIAYGGGFTKTGNSIHLGSYSVDNLNSADRMSISFTLPTIPNGTYEGWVENSKGSSASIRKVRLVVTNNPAPRPTIESATPSVAKPTDEIVLRGKNIAPRTTVHTAFGSPSNAVVDGDSIRFRLLDLPEIQDAIKDESLTGVLFPLYIYIESEQGGLKEPFLVSVQF